MDKRVLEGYEEEIKAILSGMPIEQRLAGIPPEQLAACLTPEQLAACVTLEQIATRLTPEQRLAGLDRDHQALALPLEVFRMLPEDYLRSLSPAIQAELRRRLRHSDA